jgi:hypothetical protein
MCNISGYSKTGIIEKGFQDLESARAAAKNHKGNEAIVYNEEEGTYSLHKIADNEADEKKVIEEMAEKGNTANFDPKVVEFSISGWVSDKTISVANTSAERASMTKADSTDVGIEGTKISAASLGNPKAKNEFDSLEKAVEAAKDHDGIEAVVYNKDSNTYSLYRATEDDIKNIMEKNPPYQGRILKFIVPDSFFGFKVEDKVIDTPAAALHGKKPANAPPADADTAIPDAGKPAVKASDIKPIQVDYNSISRMDPKKFKDPFLGMAIESFQKPDFAKRMDALFNDPKITDEVKNYMNNCITAINALAAGTTDGATKEQIKELLGTKIGNDSYRDLIKDMTAMVDYHDSTKNSTVGLNLSEVFKKVGDAEESIKKETGKTDVSRSDAFAEMARQLSPSDRVLINKLAAHYVSATNIEKDVRQYNKATQEEQKTLTTAATEQASAIAKMETGIQELKDVKAIFAKVAATPGYQLSESEITKISDAMAIVKSQIASGQLKPGPEDIEAINKMDEACKVYKGNKEKYEASVTAKTMARLNADNEVQELATQLSSYKANSPGEQAMVDVIAPILDKYLQISKKGDELQIALYTTYMRQVTDYLKNKQYVTDGNFDGLAKICSNYQDMVGSPPGRDGNPPAVAGKLERLFLDNPGASAAELKEKINSALEKYLGKGTQEAGLLNEIVNNTNIIDKYKVIFDKQAAGASGVGGGLPGANLPSFNMFSNSSLMLNFGNYDFGFRSSSSILNTPLMLTPPSLNPVGSLNFSTAPISLLGPVSPQLTLNPLFNTAPPANGLLLNPALNTPTTGTGSKDGSPFQEMGVEYKPTVTSTGPTPTGGSTNSGNPVANLLSKVNPADVDKLLFTPHFNPFTGKSETMIDSFAKMSLTLDDTIKNSLNSMNALKNLNLAGVNLNNISSGKYFTSGKGADALMNAAINNQQGALAEMKASLAQNMAEGAVMQETIDGFIAEADRLLAEMAASDENFDPQAADIVSLLREFRKIITELDFTSRSLNQITNARNKLDRKFQELLKENRERWDNLDAAKQVQDKSFNGSTEVSESSMSSLAKLTKLKDFLDFKLASLA